MSSGRLHDRLREMRARAAISQWEARRSGHAGGVWFRLQLLLAHARRAFIVSDEEATALRAAGFEPHPVGAELEPPKAIFVIAEDALSPSMAGREVALQDARQILFARALVLIPFR